MKLPKEYQTDLFLKYFVVENWKEILIRLRNTYISNDIEYSIFDTLLEDYELDLLMLKNKDEK